MQAGGLPHAGISEKAMLMRTLTAMIVCLAVNAPASAASLTAQLFPQTGEVRFRNPSAVDVPFVFYSITSPSGALNGSNLLWKSITDNYDASGNGFIDPLFDWTKLSSTSTQLTESVFTGPGGALPAFRSVSLGQIWNPVLYPSHDLTFTVEQADMSLVTVTTQFAIAGDYDANGTVNSLDYNTWRQNFGSTTSLAADGNLNGVVDAADYVIWRNNNGQSLPGAGSIVQGIGGSAPLQVGGTVPEPAGIVLFVSAALAAVTARAGAPRAAR
jgi:hypothetical protein